MFLRPKEGIIGPDLLMKGVPANGSGMTVAQIVRLGPDKIGIYYFVPHTTNIIPPTLDAVHLILGNFPAEVNFATVDGNEKTSAARKLLLLGRFSGRPFGADYWFEKYRGVATEKEKLLVLKFVSIGGSSKLVAALFRRILAEETSPRLLDYLRQTLAHFTAGEQIPLQGLFDVSI